LQVIIFHRRSHALLSLPESLALILIEDELIHNLLLALDKLALLFLGFEIKFHVASSRFFIDQHMMEGCQTLLVADAKGAN
jgi:hypothetical protein